LKEMFLALSIRLRGVISTHGANMPRRSVRRRLLCSGTWAAGISVFATLLIN